MKSFLDKNDMEMCSTYNEEKSVIAKKLIRTLKEQNVQIHDFSFKKCVYL